MVTDQQVVLLRQKLMEGKTQETAAAKAGICVRSARKWQSGPMPSETKQERQWRTRSDPFEGVWEEGIELEVLEQEAEDRRQRRIGRLRTTSRLPAGKTWETFEHDRMPLALRRQLDQLANGDFTEHGINVLAFGLPGTGKTHALCAVGHRLVEAGRSVLFAPAYRLVQSLPRRRPGTCSPPSGTWPCRDNYADSTTTTSCCSTTWDTGPRVRKSPRCSSHSSPNATKGAPSGSPPTWSSPSGSTSSPTPWPRRRPSTGWSTTRSS